MWTVLDKKVLKITPTLARRFAEMQCHRDRPLTPARKDRIKTWASNGECRSFIWSIAVMPDGREFRVNGKHSSLAFVEMFDAGTAPEAAYAMVESYKCENLEDVARLFATFDRRDQARSTNDINRIFAAASPGCDKLSQTIINLSVQGLSMNLWGDPKTSVDKSAHTHEDRAALMLAHEPFCLFMAEILCKDFKEMSHIARGPVAAAMARTFMKCASDARLFWTDVRDGANNSASSPQRLLERYLLTHSVRSKSKGKEIATSNEMFGRCMCAWNAFRREEKINKLQWKNGSKIPAAA